MSRMEITKRNKIIIGIVTVIILLAIYIVMDKSLRLSTNVKDDSVATTTQNNSGVLTQGTGDYKIEQVSLTSNKPSIAIPDLNRKLVLYSGAIVAPEAKAEAIDHIVFLQTRLKKDNKDFPAWIDLGIYQKQAGDYEGAIISWKYASAIAPSDFISLANLGNLYAYFIKDNGMAEVYYRKAINNGPNQSYLYSQLYEIYRDIFNDSSKAKAIINEGLSKIPNDPILVQLKNSLN